MKVYLEPEEVSMLEKAATNLRDKLLIRLLFYLGCRVSEALALTVDNVDFGNGTVTIQHLKTRLKLICQKCSARLGKNHAFCPGCGGKVKQAVAKELEHQRVRTLPLDNSTLDMLNEYVQRGGPVVKDGKRLIFGINQHRAWQIVTGCAAKVGLPKLANPEIGRARNASPHRLRDSFSVHAVRTNDTGDGLRMLQEQLGHASIATTMRYRKVAGNELKQWYNSLWENKNGK
jgi:integrase/recombinase XerD